MNPYRTAEYPIEVRVRWGVSLWKRLYVRVARKLFDLRAKYKYQREYNQYKRDLVHWYKENHAFARKVLVPMPSPPPIYIME